MLIKSRNLQRGACFVAVRRSRLCRASKPRRARSHVNTTAYSGIPRYKPQVAGVLIAMFLISTALGQSSSLYVNDSQRSARQQQSQSARRPAQQQEPQQRFAPSPQRRHTATGQRETPHRLSPAVQRSSLSAVRVPQRREFAVNDLVTIIIRESSETDFESTLETEKSSEHTGEIAEFPRLTLEALADGRLEPSQMENGNPALDVQLEREFEGEGEYSRSEEMSGRVTARIIDVKPNGTLVLEARKFVESDDESFQIRVTGTCRAEDISADNTVLSTELYDLHLSKQSDGELQSATDKGLITELLDLVFNF